MTQPIQVQCSIFSYMTMGGRKLRASIVLHILVPSAQYLERKMLPPIPFRLGF